MNENGVMLMQSIRMRCPDCGHVSTKKAKWGFYCQNPKCKVNLILGSNAVILLDSKPKHG